MAMGIVVKLYGNHIDKIKTKRVSDWFCCEHGSCVVQDRYIDAFCCRAPKSILARHYTDYSVRALKEIYDKAKLKVLS